MTGIAAPIPRKAIETAIVAWFTRATGLAASNVLLESQPTSPNQPVLPYATVFNLSPATKLGQDELRIRDASADVPAPDAGSEIEILACGLRKMVFSCNTYSKTNDADADARALMDKAHAALALPSFVAELQAVGLSVIDDGAVRSLDALQSDKFVARAQLDVTFGLASNVTENTGYIEHVEITDLAPVLPGWVNPETFEVSQ
jgi:hypothetical protein